jgi:signal transduction histidine kinase/putative methionine-R-sulfoxide reductase with GAF domain
MSETLSTDLELRHDFSALLPTIAQAPDVADLASRCAAALAALMPGVSFALTWIVDGEQQLGGKMALPAPSAEQRAQLEAGALVDDGDVAWQPLRLRGALVGWLTVAPAGLSADQASALATLAAVVAPTVATLLPAHSGASSAQLRTLNQVGQLLSGVLHIEELPEAIYEGTCRVLEAPQFYIALLEEHTSLLRILFMIEAGERMPPGPAWPASDGLSGVVMRQRATLRTDNYLRECLDRNIAPVTVGGVLAQHAWMGVPLVVNDRAIGIITVNSRRPGYRYTAEHAELLQTIAAQAAVAFENARLYQRAERQARQLNSLNRIARSITSTLDPERVPALIMEQMRELLEVEEGSLLLLDEQARDLVFAYAGGPTGEQLIGQRLPRGAGIAGNVLSTGQTAIVNNTRTDVRFYAGTDTSTGFTTRSLIAAPLRGVGGVQGVMEFINKRSGAPFTDEDRRLIEAAADQAVIALENARRFTQADQALARRAQELGRSNTQLHEILRVGNALRAERNLDTVLREITDAVSRSTGFRSAEIALISAAQAGQQSLRRVAAASSLPEYATPDMAARAPLAEFERLLRPDFQRGPATYLIDHRSGDYFGLWGDPSPLPGNDPRPDNPDAWDPRDVLLTVLRDSKGSLLGVLRVDAPDDGLLPAPEQVQTLEIFANQAAIVIENARLYEELQHGLRSLMALNGLGMAINTSLRSEEQIFGMTASGIAELTGATGARVLLSHPATGALVPLVELGNAPPLELVEREGARAVNSGRLELLSDDAAEPPAPRALVTMPLRATQGVLGVIGVAYSDSLPPAADLETLTLFATQAAVAAESRRLWQALSRGRDQLASIMASTREGIVLIDIDRQIAVANSALVRLCGLHLPLGRVSLSHFLTTWAESASYPEAEWQALGLALEAVASGEQEFANGQLNAIAASTCSLEWTALAAHGEGESDGGQLLVLRDITQEKETERLRQDLTSMIVHDLRSPLTSVLTSMDMLFRGISGGLSDVQRNILTVAQNSALQILDMVSILLDISRLEGGSMPLNLGTHELPPLIDKAAGRLTAIARDKQITFQYDYAPKLPPFRADGDLVVRVLQNLLDNALKFSARGSTIMVCATIEAGDDHLPTLRVSVRDRGVGIAPKDQSKIFDKFSQAGERRGGTGLGLTFCKLAVEAHGGTIGVESAIGEGSTFFFRLPVV